MFNDFDIPIFPVGFAHFDGSRYDVFPVHFPHGPREVRGVFEGHEAVAFGLIGLFVAHHFGL